MPKILSTTLAVAIPLIGLTVIKINAKLQKLKRKGRLTSVSALIKTLPMIYRTARFAIVEKKVKKNRYLLQLGGKLKSNSPSFRLSDHWTCRESDVICAVPMKSGTTWALQICQQLRVNGDSNVNYYQDLCDVEPWIEASICETFGPDNERAIPPDPAAGPGALDMDADHINASVRCFKSHLTWKALEGTICKKIYFYRDNVDVIYSAYRFVCGKILEVDESVTAHQYATFQILRGHIMEDNLINMCDFWDHRHDPNVGFFFYDDVKEDHAGSVKRIAQLMGIEPTPELIEKVVYQSTVKFMSSEVHHLRFDGYPRLANVKRAVGLDYSYWPEVSGQAPRGKVKNMKVPKGGGLASSTSKKAHDSIPGRDEVEECYRKTWERVVFPRTGFANLAEMRAAWKLELSSKKTL